jgi:hypothetical protein
MGVKLQSALGGSVELTAPSTASTYTLAVPAGNGTVATTDQLLGFRNRVINGDFSINQRNKTSHTYVQGNTSTYGVMLADAWKLSNQSPASNSTVGTITSTIEVYDNKNWAKTTITTPFNGTVVSGNGWTVRPGAYFGEDTCIQDLIGQQVTLSMLFRANNNGQYSVTFGYPTDNKFTIFSFNYTGSGNPQRVSWTFTIPTDFFTGKSSYIGWSMYISYGVQAGDTRISNETNLNGVFGGAQLTRSSDLRWWDTANNWIAFTEVQLEKGSIFSSYEKRPYAIELTLCQRYYEEVWCQWGTAIAATMNNHYNSYRVTKLKPPSLTVYADTVPYAKTGTVSNVRNTTANNNIAVNSVNGDSASLNGFVIEYGSPASASNMRATVIAESGVN